MKLNRLKLKKFNRCRWISLLLSFVLMAACPVSAATAEGTSGKTVTISYIVQPDAAYGAPNVLNPAESQTPGVGEEFVLAEPLRTDSILGTDTKTGEMYIGTWTFSGWTVPEYITTRQAESAPDVLYDAEYSALIKETETDILCKSTCDADITGCWSFVPEEKLVIPDEIDTDESLPLAGTYDALAEFWPERETDLNKVYATGLFPESFIRYMDENIREIPLHNENFASVELTDAERAGFLEAVKQVYDALTSDNGDAPEVKAGIEALTAADESGNASLGTAFVVYCAGQAGLLEGKSKSLTETADVSLLVDYLQNEACADFITMQELLQIYSAEQGQETVGLNVNGTTVDYAHEEGWYDVANRKNTILPGDLILFRDSKGNPETMGIIDSVEEHSITYVMLTDAGYPTEATLEEDDVRRLSQTEATAEIIGLRSCDSARIIFEFLVDEMELPQSSAIAIMSNIYYESKFSTTDLGDGNTSFGLCQWHNDRFLNLVIFCMKNNYNIATLEGQLKFLEYELTKNYPGLLAELRQCGISASWAKEAATRFCQVFEQPANVETSAALRGATAAGTIWDSYSELFLSQTRLENMKLAKAAEVIAAEQQSEYILYTVKKGDTLTGICWRLGFQYYNYRRDILSLNSIANENRIEVGQILTFARKWIPG